jgi:hypothetical protein
MAIHFNAHLLAQVDLRLPNLWARATKLFIHSFIHSLYPPEIHIHRYRVSHLIKVDEITCNKL